MVGPSPRDISHPFRNIQRAQVLALGGEDPNTAGARAIQVSFLIDLLAIRRTDPRIGGGIEENLSVGQRAIGFHGITHPELFRL